MNIKWANKKLLIFLATVKYIYSKNNNIYLIKSWNRQDIKRGKSSNKMPHTRWAQHTKIRETIIVKVLTFIILIYAILFIFKRNFILFSRIKYAHFWGTNAVFMDAWECKYWTFFLSASVYLIYTSFSLEFSFMMSRRRPNSFFGDLTIFQKWIFFFWVCGSWTLSVLLSLCKS